MKILLTFTGFHDPYSVGLIEDEELSGPILSLVREVQFDKIVLFSTPNTRNNTLSTRDVLLKLNPNLVVEIIDLLIDDPTDYLQILSMLRKYIGTIFQGSPTGETFISVASGTPQMHACWLLLVAGGELPARVLHVRPARFATKEKPLISEVDLAAHHFPVVRQQVVYGKDPDVHMLDFESVLNGVGLVGNHPTMRKAFEVVEMLAPADVPILIFGETGTGKELFAKLIHKLSARSGGTFVPVNCGAIPKELVESILFGHKKGSFTGAYSDQIGKFDAANNGTLFLDELGELPVSAQSKLLRVIQDGRVEPLGQTKAHKVNVRIVAATNRKLSEAIREGSFRQDLYYRLNVGEISIPPLRNRKSDIPQIALSVLDRINGSLRTPRRLSTSALRKLQTYAWPGNVRELGNLLERSVRLSHKTVLDENDLIGSDHGDGDLHRVPLPEPELGFSLEGFLSEARQVLVSRALELSEGNQSKAASLLGVSPQAVHKFIRTRR
jgi:DNA-binding NtrC family response regulator